MSPWFATMSGGAQTLVKALATRRSIYALGKDTSKILSNADISQIVKEVVRQSPSSFNSQSSRVVSIVVGQALGRGEKAG